jgi:large conductance mechanosensitive channel
MGGFQKFLLRGNVVDLAVAVVIGAAFGVVVTAFVQGFVTPLIGAFGGVPDLAAWTFTVNGSVFKPGLFLSALLAFLIVALVVYYFVVVPTQRLIDRYRPDEPAPAQSTRECPECLSKIPLAARRCAYCTAAVNPT